MWDRVHSILRKGSRKRAALTRAQTPALLKGLIFGPTGRAMTPTHTRKRGRLYRYYVSIRKRISRVKVLEFFEALPPCLVGIEACPSAHHWSRSLQALGHTVRLMPPSYVKAYLKRSKNDANDAAAICEAVTRGFFQDPHLVGVAEPSSMNF